MPISDNLHYRSAEAYWSDIEAEGAQDMQS